MKRLFTLMIVSVLAAGSLVFAAWVPRVRQAKPGEGGRDDVSQR
jgi:hypothetical protein